jgi:hypothetical protein
MMVKLVYKPVFNHNFTGLFEKQTNSNGIRVCIGTQKQQEIEKFK